MNDTIDAMARKRTLPGEAQPTSLLDLGYTDVAIVRTPAPGPDCPPLRSAPLLTVVTLMLAAGVRVTCRLIALLLAAGRWLAAGEQLPRIGAWQCLRKLSYSAGRADRRPVPLPWGARINGGPGSAAPPNDLLLVYKQLCRLSNCMF